MNSRKGLVCAACVVLLSLGMCNSAWAQGAYDGHRVRMAREWFGGAIERIVLVGPGLEAQDWPSPLFWDIDISGDTIEVIEKSAGYYTPGEYNGVLFQDVDGTIPEIIGVTVASDLVPLSGYPPMDESRITSDADTIWVDFQGLENGPSMMTTLTVKFVPEPATVTLLALGPLFLLRRRRC